MKHSPEKWRPLQSPLVFVILASLLLVALYNWRFWHETVAAANPSSVEDFLFLLSLFIILVMAHAGVLLLMPDARAMKVTAAIAFVVAASTGFFIDSYNVVIDREMVRNLFETDGQEASAFLVPQLGLYLLLLGLLPAAIALRVPLIKLPPRRQELDLLGSCWGIE